MSIKKHYLKSKPVCKCTFRLPREAAPDAGKVNLVGEFNGWNLTDTPMKRLKSGEFKLQLNLETGRRYQFRYLIDGETWENDWDADAYEPVPGLAVDNSVVHV